VVLAALTAVAVLLATAVAVAVASSRRSKSRALAAKDASIAATAGREVANRLAVLRGGGTLAPGSGASREGVVPPSRTRPAFAAAGGALGSPPPPPPHARTLSRGALAGGLGGPQRQPLVPPQRQLQQPERPEDEGEETEWGVDESESVAVPQFAADSPPHLRGMSRKGGLGGPGGAADDATPASQLVEFRSHHVRDVVHAVNALAAMGALVSPGRGGIAARPAAGALPPLSAGRVVGSGGLKRADTAAQIYSPLRATRGVFGGLAVGAVPPSSAAVGLSPRSGAR
jgi:hypothetical protein